MEGRIGVHVGLQTLDGANHTVKVFFSDENTVSNLIIGYHPEVNAVKVKPHDWTVFQLRWTEERDDVSMEGFKNYFTLLMFQV